jgi:hypothetical protein
MPFLFFKRKLQTVQHAVDGFNKLGEFVLAGSSRNSLFKVFLANMTSQVVKVTDGFLNLISDKHAE